MKNFYWMCPSWLYHVELVHMGRKVVALQVFLGVPIGRKVIRELSVSMK